MGPSTICQEIFQLVEPILKVENLELVDVEYKKEGKHWYLRIFIDKISGITLSDCQKISHRIEDLIEIESLINQRYILEVSSPGLDRPLKKERDFLRNKDRKIRLATLSPIQDKKRFSGVIKDVQDDSLVLETEGRLMRIPLTIITKAKLEIGFSK